MEKTKESMHCSKILFLIKQSFRHLTHYLAINVLVVVAFAWAFAFAAMAISNLAIHIRSLDSIQFVVEEETGIADLSLLSESQKTDELNFPFLDHYSIIAKSKNSDESLIGDWVQISPNLPELLSFKMVEGLPPSEKLLSDGTNCWISDRVYANNMGLKVGNRIKSEGQEFIIQGVFCSANTFLYRSILYGKQSPAIEQSAQIIYRLSDNLQINQAASLIDQELVNKLGASNFVVDFSSASESKARTLNYLWSSVAGQALFAILVLALSMANVVLILEGKFLLQLQSFAVELSQGAQNFDIFGQFFIEQSVLIIMALPLTITLIYASTKLIPYSIEMLWNARVIFTLIFIVLLVLTVSSLRLLNKANRISLAQLMRGEK